jgi:hypothetical protein
VNTVCAGPLGVVTTEVLVDLTLLDVVAVTAGPNIGVPVPEMLLVPVGLEPKRVCGTPLTAMTLFEFTHVEQGDERATEASEVASEPSLQGTVTVKVTPEVTMTMVFIVADVAEVPLFVEFDSTLLEVLLPEDGLLIDEEPPVGMELAEHDVLELVEEEVPTEVEEDALLDDVEADDVLVDDEEALDSSEVEEVLVDGEVDEVAVLTLVDDVFESNEEDEDGELVSGVQFSIANDCTETPDCVPLLVTSNSVHSSLRNICID